MKRLYRQDSNRFLPVTLMVGLYHAFKTSLVGTLLVKTCFAVFKINKPQFNLQNVGSLVNDDKHEREKRILPSSPIFLLQEATLNVAA